MVIGMTGVVDDVVVAEVFLDKGDIHRIALKVHVKDIPFLIEKVFDLDSLLVRGV